MVIQYSTRKDRKYCCFKKTITYVIKWSLFCAPINMLYKCSRGNDTRHEESWIQGLHQGPLQRQVWRRHVTSACQDGRGRVLPEDRGIIRVIFVYLQLHTNNHRDEIELFRLNLESWPNFMFILFSDSQLRQLSILLLWTNFKCLTFYLWHIYAPVDKQASFCVSREGFEYKNNGMFCNIL